MPLPRRRSAHRSLRKPPVPGMTSPASGSPARNSCNARYSSSPRWSPTSLVNVGASRNSTSSSIRNLRMNVLEEGGTQTWEHRSARQSVSFLQCAGHRRPGSVGIVSQRPYNAVCSNLRWEARSLRTHRSGRRLGPRWQNLRTDSVLATLLDLLDVRQPPRLLEQRFFGAVEAEEHLEPTIGARGNPVRLLADRWLGPEVDVHRSISVLLQSRCLGRAARPSGIPNGRMGGAVVDRR